MAGSTTEQRQCSVGLPLAAKRPRKSSESEPDESSESASEEPDKDDESSESASEEPDEDEGEGGSESGAEEFYISKIVDSKCVLSPCCSSK
jgi:hypothetical protein